MKLFGPKENKEQNEIVSSQIQEVGINEDVKTETEVDADADINVEVETETKTEQNTITLAVTMTATGNKVEVVEDDTKDKKTKSKKPFLCFVKEVICGLVIAFILYCALLPIQIAIYNFFYPEPIPTMKTLFETYDMSHPDVSVQEEIKDKFFILDSYIKRDNPDLTDEYIQTLAEYHQRDFVEFDDYDEAFKDRITWLYPEDYDKEIEDTVYEELKKVPDEVKRCWLANEGMIYICPSDGYFLNQYNLEDDQIVSKKEMKEDGSYSMGMTMSYHYYDKRYKSNIYLRGTKKNIQRSLAHEFGHVLFYEVFGYLAPEDHIKLPYYDRDIDNFIQNECDNYDYFRDYAEYFAQLFQYYCDNGCEPSGEYADTYVLESLISSISSKDGLYQANFTDFIENL